MSKKINSVQSGTEGVTVAIEGQEKFFSWFWVRDHSQEPGDFHSDARQRLLETFSLDGVDQADEVSVDGSGDVLTVRWNESSVRCRFTADYLAAVAPPEEVYDEITGDRVLWGANEAHELCKSAEFEDFVNDDEVLGRMLDNLRRFGMVSVKNVPLEIQASRRAMERIGYIRSSIFGDMWELKSDGKLADTGSTPLEIKPHTDGTYNYDAPGLMSLHCLQYEATGGDNILVDGFNVARIMQREHPEAYETLSTVPVPGQYIGDGAYLVAWRAPLRHDASGRLVQVSFNNHDRAPFVLPEPEMTRLYDALEVFDNLIRDRSNQFIFGQRPGDMVIFDNWRLLHGRMPFDGQRHMVGSYLNREEFESRLRLLGDCPMDMVARVNDDS